MKWPWVSRAKYEELCDVAEGRAADLVETGREIARLRVELANVKAKPPRERKAAATTNGTPAKKAMPVNPAITKAIRTVAGNDGPMARHLKAVAEARLREDVPVRDIIREIHEGAPL